LSYIRVSLAKILIHSPILTLFSTLEK